MPQPRKQTTRKASTSARKSSAAGTTKKRATAARQTAQQRKAAAKRRTTTAKKKPAASRRSSSSARAAAGPADEVRRNAQNAIEALSHGVVITRDRLQEVLDEAVERGRLTRDDANSIVADVLKRGRKQTTELRKQAEAMRADLEQLLGRAGDQIEKRATSARKKAVRVSAGDRALREVDRARRATGLARFPISNYEDMTAGQISGRLGDLSPAELRKVRDHERRNANRKSVLSSIEKALG